MQVLVIPTSNVATMGVGSTDIFIAQQPYASWTVGVNTMVFTIWRCTCSD